MYSLLSIFIIIPLIFSHTFARLGESFIIENGIGSFESVKVSVFFVLIFCATTEIAISKNEFFSKKTLILLSAIIGFILFEYTLFGPESVFGIGEKQHGSLFFASLLWFGYLLSEVEKNHQKLFIDTIISTALIVALIAIVEYLFSYNIFSGFIDNTGSSWGNGRATATLGNPNYVAGYLLIILPFLGTISSKWKLYASLIILPLGIISTGSVIGIVLCILYYIYFALGRLPLPHARSIFIALVIISGIILFEILSGSEKWLSLSSRFILMKETFMTTIENSHTNIIGAGPNGIIEHYENVRTKEIMSYFPLDMIIDSSHNIFIDLFAKFGILPFIGFFYFMRKKWSHLNKTSCQGLILAILFLSLNVGVLSHYIIMVYLLLSGKQKA